MKEIIDEDVLLKVTPMGSYSPDDVTFLLKDISSLIEEKGTQDREEAIQSGVHYSEMLPVEYRPSQEYLDLFHSSLEASSEKLAVAVGVVSNQILKRKLNHPILVSLARAGTPIGILIKRYLKFRYRYDFPHYTISIIRGKGIDENALKYILDRHPADNIQFIDGWTGKGAITRILIQACRDFHLKYSILLDNSLAVLADPGHCSNIFGTREDFLIPSACLNSTVSGLVSRTVHRPDLIGENDFHGAKYYKELAKEDVSNYFIDTIAKKFKAVESTIEMISAQTACSDDNPPWLGLKDIEGIKGTFGIEDINLIKPGVGETTRVLLRRVPWKILVKDKQNPNLKHILILAKDRNVPVEEYTQMSYQCCGLIKQLKGGK